LASRYLRSLTLWPTGPWFDSVLWTLPVEVVFYGFVFLCLVGRLPMAWLLRTLAIVSALYWALRLGSQLHLTTAADGLSESFARLSMLAFGGYFAVGGLLREIAVRGWTTERSIFLVISLAAGCAQIAFAASSWASEGALARIPHAGKLVPLAAWLALVMLMVVSVRGNALAWHWFTPAAPTIRLLGLATYPLYLLHDTVGDALKFAPAARTSLIASTLAIGLSMVFAATIEPWAQRWLRRALSAGTRHQPVSEPQIQMPPQT
jgi:exopolysaccharide production protein ExoZ